MSRKKVPNGEICSGRDEVFPVTTLRNAEYPQVAVCFVDIRGFTRFARTKDAEGKIDQILSCVFEAVNQALAQARNNIKGDSLFAKNIRKAIWPNLRKPLGDGAMLVWDYPKEGGEIIETGFDLFILDFAGYLQSAFYENLNKLGKGRVLPSLKALHLGIGLSKGHAWKMFRMGNTTIDYAGNTINEAARLQDVARPHGIVAHLKLATNLLMERFCFEMGSDVRQARLKGFDGDNPSVWMKTYIKNKNQPPTANEKMGWRHPRKDSFDAAKTLLEGPYDFEFLDCEKPLTECDTKSLFDLRAEQEARFASDLATNVRDGLVKPSTLDPIRKSIVGMEKLLANRLSSSEEWRKHWRQLGADFHSGIAKNSSAKDGLQRMHFTEQAYVSTKRVYDFATKKISHKQIIHEHTQILRAIENGNPGLARRHMEEHLTSHYTKAREVLFRRPPAMAELNNCPMRKQCPLLAEAK